MLKYILIAIIFCHGLIHLIGFSAGFGLGQSTSFTGKTILSLSKSAIQIFAILWLCVTLLFAGGGIALLLHKLYWWQFALVAIILSQLLITIYWHDAKAGTIANLIILLPVIVGIANTTFFNKATKETERILTQTTSQKNVLTMKDIEHLPECVKNWIIKSGAIDREIVHAVYLQQKGFMCIKPGSKYMPCVAEQYFNIDNPAFVWTVNVDMMPAVQITGRDKFENGHGNMLIKLYSLFTFANGTGSAIDQGTMLRYLGEICWFPSAAVQPYIKWEEVGKHSARAIMTYENQTVSAIFTFDNDGQLIRTDALRYMGMGKEASLQKWYIPCNEWKSFEGIRVPSKGDAIWKLKEGDYNYYKWEITDIRYNIPNKPNPTTIL